MASAAAVVSSLERVVGCRSSQLVGKRLRYYHTGDWAEGHRKRSAAVEVHQHHRRRNSAAELDKAAAAAAGFAASLVVGEKHFGVKRKDPAVERVGEVEYVAIGEGSRAFEESEEFATLRPEASAMQAHLVT